MPLILLYVQNVFFLDTAHDIKTGNQVFLVPEMCLMLFDSAGQLTKVLSVIVKPKLR